MHIILDNSNSAIYPPNLDNRRRFEAERERFNTYGRLIAGHILFVVDLNHRSDDALAGVTILQPYINSLSRDLVPYQELTPPQEPDYRLPINRVVFSATQIHSHALSELYPHLTFIYSIDYYVADNHFQVRFNLTTPNRDRSAELVLAEGRLEFSDLLIASASVIGEITLNRCDWLIPGFQIGVTPSVQTRQHRYLDRILTEIEQAPVDSIRSIRSDHLDLDRE